MRENEDAVDWQLSSLRLTCYSFMGVHFPRHLTPYAGTTEVGNQAVSQETTLNAVMMTHGYPHQTKSINQRKAKTLSIPLSRLTRKIWKAED